MGKSKEAKGRLRQLKEAMGRLGKPREAEGRIRQLKEAKRW